jgi:hypothetical protein
VSGLELATLVGLGVFHGLNPGMGWLFAVAFGLQERSRRAVLAALPPIAAGHAAAIAVALTLLQVAQALLTTRGVAVLSAGLLTAVGGWHLVKRRHVRWVGMRLRSHELAMWSFVMASVHGAGLMLLPVLLHSDAQDETSHPVTGLVAASVVGPTAAAGAAAIHTAAMLLAMGAIALLVYDRLGLRILRQAWINVDVLWAVALVAAGLFALFS